MFGSFDRYDEHMGWRDPGPVRHPPGFIERCLPTFARTVPTGAQWIYEIKHDGFRFISTAKNRLSKEEKQELIQRLLAHVSSLEEWWVKLKPTGPMALDNARLRPQRL